MNQPRHGFRALADATISRSTRTIAAGKILRVASPSRRIDAGRAAERLDAQAGIVSQRRQFRRGDGGLRLNQRIGDECVAGLLRFGQTKLAGRCRL